MAGTRRRSRVGGTNAHRNQRSMSHTASLVNGSADAEALKAAETAECAGETSPRPATPISRSTKGFCRNCESNIGEFYNSWHKVTGSYFVPALLGSYRSLLKSTGKQKAASRGTDLEGCTIQPLSCPASGCTDSPIGFTVVDAPAEKRNFRGRDFFKLSRIELRCELSPNTTIAVEPQENTAPQFLTVEVSASPTPDPTTPTAPLTEAMEVDSRPPASQHPGINLNQHEHNHRHDLSQPPLQQVKADKQSLPKPSSAQTPPGLAPLHSISPIVPSNLLSSQTPTVIPMHEVQYTPQQPSMETTVGSTSATWNIPAIATQSRPSHKLHQANGQPYPRSLREVGLDAIERLQTQISQNSGALAAHTRDIRRGEESFQQLEGSLRQEFQAQLVRQSGDIRRVDEAVARLHHEMQGMRQALEGLSRDMHATRVDRQSHGSTVPLGQSISVQDSALELMAQQIATMSQKANEVDMLKITVEILRNKIQRLEEGATSAPSQPTPHTYRPPREPTKLQSSQTTQAAALHHATVAALPHISTPTQPAPSVQSYPTYWTPSSTATPEILQRSEPVPSQSSGWVTVNAGVKRTHPNGIESPHDSTVHLPASPKRQRLATIESHATYAASQNQAPTHYEHMDSGGREVQTQAYSHTLPPQYSIPESIAASQSQQSVHIPYGTQDGPSDDSWRPESQRVIEHRPHGRARGGGLGSRGGGRGRKSMPAQLHTLGTPEWEGDDWQGVPESQTSPDGYYNHVARSGRGIARRGSGGGGARGAYVPRDRDVSLGLQGVTAGMATGSPSDPYGHSKKTRTKPIRNADGVLIRKDGRPDMRSQSSAANLRKVHARKEGDPTQSPSQFTPTNLHDSNSAGVPDTPSPNGFAPDHNVAASVHEKHSAIMDKMFPSGVDESRKQHDYTRQVFEEDMDHTVHPRTQHYHHPVNKTSLQIKKERVEQNGIAELQSALNDDADLDHAEHHADDKGHTPREQSDDSEQEIHETLPQEATAQVRPKDTEARFVAETQAMEHSAFRPGPEAQT